MAAVRDSEAIQDIRRSIWGQLVDYFRENADKPIDFFGKDYFSPKFLEAMEPILVNAGVDTSDKSPKSLYYECQLYAAEWWEWHVDRHVQVQQPSPESGPRQAESD